MNKNERRRWIDSVIRADLPPGQRLVLLALEDLVDNTDGMVWVNRLALAEMCRCSEQLVKQALHQGVALGRIEPIQVLGRWASYQLLPVVRL